eukprot:ANDGO_03213.mRNA.1 Metal transporter nramp1 homolog
MGTVQEYVELEDVDDEEMPLSPAADDRLFAWKKLWKFVGPGLIMSVAFIDPGNLESDLQAGATAGFQLLWVLLWCTVLGLLLQLLAMRLGVVTGKTLAETCRDRYPMIPRRCLWFLIEMAIVASDIQEVVGSSIALNLLSNGKIPLWAGILITAADTFTFLLIDRYGARPLEAVFGVMISLMVATFGIEYIIAKPNQELVLKGLAIPYVSSNNVTQAVGILGAVIMPHNLFLHSGLVLSRKINRSDQKRVRSAIFYNTIESTISLFVSFVINLFVVAVFAEAFYGSDDADAIGLQNAGYKLRDVYGDAALYIWAVGLLASGQSSTMTGTYSGQLVMQGFVNLKVSAWKRVFITRSIAIVPAMIVALVSQSNYDVVDEYLNVLQSILLPFALIPTLVFASDPSIMGPFALGKKMKCLFWFCAMLVLSTNIYLVQDFVATTLPQTGLVYAATSIVGIFYFAFVVYLAIGPDRSHRLIRALSCRKAAQRDGFQAVN